MRLYIAAVLGACALGLTACDPHAADSPGTATPPADAPAPRPSAAFDGEFKLIGTEPFWDLTIKGSQLRLERLENRAVIAPRTPPVMEGQSAVWTSGALMVRLTPGDCSDGMSERDYSYMATVKVGDVTLDGCGDRPEALAAQPG
jgi:uncharacterized membrane protein